MGPKSARLGSDRMNRRNQMLSLNFAHDRSRRLWAGRKQLSDKEHCRLPPNSGTLPLHIHTPPGPSTELSRVLPEALPIYYLVEYSITYLLWVRVVSVKQNLAAWSSEGNLKNCKQMNCKMIKCVF